MAIRPKVFYGENVLRFEMWAGGPVCSAVFTLSCAYILMRVTKHISRSEPRNYEGSEWGTEQANPQG